MRHRFTSGKGQVLEAREQDGSLRLYHITQEKRGARGEKKVVEVQRRLDEQPLKPAVATALIQEILRLAGERSPNG